MKRVAPQTVTTIGVLIVLAIVAIVTARPSDPEYASYASTDYGSGGYRAWAALLAREGVRTSRFVLRPIELDERIDTLVSAQPLPALTDPATRTEADLAGLARWVRAGGRLVYVGRNAALAAAETRLLDLPFFLPDVGARGGLHGPLARSTGPLAELGANRMLLVEHAGRAELSDGNGDVVVRYPLGRGEIVAVVDTVPFTNANIVTPGNARLAYLIGLPRTAAGVVAFDDGLHGALIDRPWYRALPLAVRLSLAIGACAALLALVGSSLRTGPPVRLDPSREPTSGEFVDAVATLYARAVARAAASAILIRAAIAVAARAHSRSDAVAPAELAAVIREPDRAAAVRRLGELLAAPPETDAELVASAKLAHTVRKEWSHGGYGDGRRAAFAGRTRARGRR